MEQEKVVNPFEIFEIEFENKDEKRRPAEAIGISKERDQELMEKVDETFNRLMEADREAAKISGRRALVHKSTMVCEVSKLCNTKEELAWAMFLLGSYMFMKFDKQQHNRHPLAQLLHGL